MYIYLIYSGLLYIIMCSVIYIYVILIAGEGVVLLSCNVRVLSIYFIRALLWPTITFFYRCLSKKLKTKKPNARDPVHIQEIFKEEKCINCSCNSKTYIYVILTYVAAGPHVEIENIVFFFLQYISCSILALLLLYSYVFVVFPKIPKQKSPMLLIQYINLDTVKKKNVFLYL